MHINWKINVPYELHRLEQGMAYRQMDKRTQNAELPLYHVPCQISSILLHQNYILRDVQTIY